MSSRELRFKSDGLTSEINRFGEISFKESNQSKVGIGFRVVGPEIESGMPGLVRQGQIPGNS